MGEDGLMGLLHHHREDPQSNRYIMKERLLAIATDFYIENTAGHRCYWVDGKALRVRETMLFKELDGHELFKVQQRKIRMRKTMKITEPHGSTVATIHEHLIEPIHQRFDIDVEGEQPMVAKGNVLAHEYTIKREGTLVATISKKWIRVRDTYVVEVADGVSVPFILAVAAALDEMSDPG